MMEVRVYEKNICFVYAADKHCMFCIRRIVCGRKYAHGHDLYQQ